MIKNICLLVLLMLSLSLKAQISNFEKGYLAGYKAGYCYTSNQNSSWYCNPPAFIPSPPFPTYPESSESYMDGYNRGLLNGRKRRDADDNISNNSNNNNVAKFNPYVSQLPQLTPEEINRINKSLADRDRAQAEALSNLLNVIFTRKTLSPSEKLRRDMERSIRENEAYQRKKVTLMQKEANRLIIGSNEYISCKKSKNKWLGIAAVALAGGIYSYLQANQLSNNYQNANFDAEKYRRNGNTFYQIAPVCLSVSGFSIVEFFLKDSKVRHAKSRP